MLVLILLNKSIIVQASVCLLGFCYLKERKGEKECKVEIYKILPLPWKKILFSQKRIPLQVKFGPSQIRAKVFW